MERVLVVEGECHVVECAVERDGSVPAKLFMDDLRAGTWEPTLDKDHPDEQLQDLYVFLDFCKRLADEALPPRRHQYNYLQSGIWEFKRATKRLTWFDTDGAGEQVPKPPYRSRSEAEFPDIDEWSFPLLDEYIRLGHAFPKSSQRTADLDIHEAERIRAEDIEHDAAA